MPENCWTKVGIQIKIKAQFPMCTEKPQKGYFSCEYKGWIRKGKNALRIFHPKFVKFLRILHPQPKYTILTKKSVA